MKEIPLSKGKVAIVDDCDYEYLSRWRWYYSSGYAKRTVYKGKNVYMHRDLANTPDGMDTDHINHNKLDNRRENLRACTRTQNQRNISMIKSNKSGKKGVSWHSSAKKWEACIKFCGKKIYLGIYDDVEDASRAYNEKSVELFGEFSHILCETK